MSTPSLERRIETLESTLAGDDPLGPSPDVPFAVFVYEPDQEFELRRQVELLATRLRNAGQHVEIVDLAEIMWDCFEDHPAGPEALYEAEAEAGDVEVALKEARTLVAGWRNDEPGPLEAEVLERLRGLDRDSSVALLVNAGELYPIYHTSALLERLIGREVQVRTVLFYPGTRSGSAELRFMGVCEPSPNYRATIF